MATWISCKGCGCVVADVALHASVCPMTPPPVDVPDEPAPETPEDTP